MPALPSRIGDASSGFGVNRGALGREMRGRGERGSGERGCPGREIGGRTDRLMGDPRGRTGDCAEGNGSEADDTVLGCERSFSFSSSDNVSIDLLRSTVND
jgi:hypothetical protein